MPTTDPSPAPLLLTVAQVADMTFMWLLAGFMLTADGRLFTAYWWWLVMGVLALPTLATYRRR